MKTILVVEDDRRIAHNISRSMQDEGYQTVTAYDGPTGLEQAQHAAIGLVILDVNLPGLNGFDVCRQLRVSRPHLPIIMLTALGEIPDKVQGLTSGADDYMVKPFDLRELTARVATALRRVEQLATPVADQMLEVADLQLNLTTKNAHRQGKTIELTAKEFALLEELMRHAGRVVSKAELTGRVWQMAFDPGTNVVEVYINYLRRKIDRDFTPKLIQTRPGMGYFIAEL